jgi:diguanylate cyclase (GGDEF)-like protein
MISEGLKVALSTTDPEESIMIILEYMGKTLESERTYIFQLEGNLWSNTYEWCANGVEPQIDRLQKIPFDTTAQWMERFQRNENVIISDLCNIRQTDPLIYAILQPQNIRSLLVSPLIYHNEVVGFYGVDNPPSNQLKNISSLFLIIGSFMVSLIRRKALFAELERISYYDQLTGFQNRHAMQKFAEEHASTGSIGVIYCDVIGLKRINDTEGHHAGDLLLLRACDCIRAIFPHEKRYRIGGDEFLVLCPGISKEKLEEKTRMLKQKMQEQNALMAVGALWKEQIPEDFDTILSESDHLMYQDKRTYYAEIARNL